MVVNPHGGLKKGMDILELVKPIFQKAGAELTVLTTEYAGHAHEYARDVSYCGYDGFCAIGGDGTMHEIINGMLKRDDGQKLPIGLVSGGTGNSFLYGLDCLDPVEAAKRIVSGNTNPIDIARIDSNGEIIYAFNVIGWGLAVDGNITADKMRWLGSARYDIAAIIELLKGKKRLAKLIIGDKTYDEDYEFIIACNTVYTAKAMKMAPIAKIDDGMIDLIIVKKTSRINLLKAFPKVATGEHMESPLVDYQQVKEFSIIPKESSILNIDGEMIGDTPIRVTVEQGRINVLV